MSLRVRDLADHLDRRIPFAWAEAWDRVGLLVGDPDAVLDRVFVSLDPTQEAIRRASAAGAQVLLTHHPAYLEPPARLVPGSGAAGVPFAAAAAGIALIACHTNLDRAPEGADALPAVLAAAITGPLERGAQPVSIVTLYAPHDAVDAIRAAMECAGAGRIGQYAGCSFTSDGTGEFVALYGSASGRHAAGSRANAAESRLEMVCPRDLTAAVLVAARAAHPYEEPVVLAQEATLSRGAARMGRLCEAGEGATLGSLAARVGAALGVGVTVWGDVERAVRVFATAPGSGRSLVPAALAAGADVLVTGELRYHEAHDALEAGLAVIEAGHDATEWPLTRALAAIAEEIPELAEGSVVMDVTECAWTTIA